MKSTSRVFLRGVAACALVCVAVSVTQAATIIKLNLGGVGPDVGMGAPAGQPAGVFSTFDQTGGPPPAGDQFTDVEYTGFLNFIPDINTSNATFSLNGLQLNGPATVLPGLVIQNFQGGSFQLFDPLNNLLLGSLGPLGNSALAGVIGGGSGGTGALFTTTLNNVDPASLLFPFIAQGSVSLSMNMTNVNGGAGFSVGGGGPQLNQFLADASISIAADPIPEPASLMLLGIGSAVAIAYFRRRRR